MSKYLEKLGLWLLGYSTHKHKSDGGYTIKSSSSRLHFPARCKECGQKVEVQL